MRLRSFFGACAFVLASAGCHDNVTMPTPGPPIQGVPVHGLVVALTADGHCLVAKCVPPGDRIHIVLSTVSLTNNGLRTVYLAPCGDSPRLILQEKAGSDWAPEASAILCPVGHGPVALAAGATIQFNQYLAIGSFRFAGAVATDSSATDELPVYSNVVNIILAI